MFTSQKYLTYFSQSVRFLFHIFIEVEVNDYNVEHAYRIPSNLLGIKHEKLKSYVVRICVSSLVLL